MQAGKIIGIVVLLAVIGWFGNRILSLEHEVTRISQHVGPRALQDPAAPVSGAASASQSERIDRFERKLEGWAATHQPSVRALSPAQPRAHAESNILSVIEQEKTRITDVQLEFHRTRWLEGREAQLNAFAQATGLTAEQRANLKAQLEREVDDIVNVVANPDFVASPDHAVADWDAALERTNAVAHQILEPDQALIWDQARWLERQILWPWLPKP